MTSPPWKVAQRASIFLYSVALAEFESVIGFGNFCQIRSFQGQETQMRMSRVSLTYSMVACLHLSFVEAVQIFLFVLQQIIYTQFDFRVHVE